MWVMSSLFIVMVTLWFQHILLCFRDNACDFMWCPRDLANELYNNAPLLPMYNNREENHSYSQRDNCGQCEGG